MTDSEGDNDCEGVGLCVSDPVGVLECDSDGVELELSDGVVEVEQEEEAVSEGEMVTD